jgi:hypothetical protein
MFPSSLSIASSVRAPSIFERVARLRETAAKAVSPKEEGGGSKTGWPSCDNRAVPKGRQSSALAEPGLAGIRDKQSPHVESQITQKTPEV